jgi:WD40 repeat protein
MPGDTGAAGLPSGLLAPPEGSGEVGRLGGYRVLKVLGAGGMGVVLQAEDPQLHRPVALKVMLPAVAANAGSRERFMREARAAAAIEHDNIVAIYQVGEDRGVPFIAMPLLKGESLEDRLRRERRLPVREVLRIGREAARGLAAAHERGLTHRDIKPGNLWLEAPRGRVKILDFGLARGAGTQGPALTQQGAIVGTPAYMAPEQASAREPDARADLFSLGCVLYQASTGKPPFGGADLLSTLMAVATSDPPPPRSVSADIPVGLNDLILRLLAKDPKDRPATARAVAAAIRDLEKGGGDPRRSGRRLVLVGGAAVLVGAVLLTALAVHFARWEKEQVRGAAPDAEPQVAETPVVKPLEVPTPPVAPNNELADGSPLSTMALVHRPAAVPGVKSWTVEAVGHRGRVQAVAYSPDGRWLVSGGVDGTVRLWSPGQGQPQRILFGHNGPVRCLAWSWDGARARLATGGRDGTVCVWDPEEGRLLARLEAPGGPVRAVAWQGNRRVAAFSDETVRVWDVEAGKLDGPERKGPEASAVEPAWSPDGTTLAAARERAVELWDAATGRKVRELTGHAEQVTALAWSPDGKRVAAAARDGAVRVWDSDSGQALPTVMHFKVSEARDAPTAMAWGPGGKALAVAGIGESVPIWDVESGTPKRELQKPLAAVHAITWKPDGLGIAAAGFPGAIWVWTGPTPKRTGTYPAADIGSEYPRPVWSPDGRTLGFGHDNGVVLLWDPLAGRFLRTLGRPHANDPGLHFAWSPDGKRIAIQSGGAAVVYDAASGDVLASSGAHPTPLGHVSWSPDGRLLATTGTQTDHTLRVCDAATGKLVSTIPTQFHSAWSPDGKTLATAGVALELWDPRTGKRAGSLPGRVRRGGPLAWSPDGRLLAAAGADRTVLLWDTNTRQLRSRLTGPTALVAELRWPSDDRVVAHCRDGRLFTWDPGTGREVSRLTHLHSAGVLSPDTRLLAVPQPNYSWSGTAMRVRTVEQNSPALILVVLRSGNPTLWLALSARGDYQGSPGLSGHFIVVAETDKGQETLAPEDFAAKYGWKNNPARVTLEPR